MVGNNSINDEIVRTVRQLFDLVETQGKALKMLTQQVSTLSQDVDNLTSRMDNVTRQADNNTSGLRELVQMVDSLTDTVGDLLRKNRLQEQIQPQPQEPRGEMDSRVEEVYMSDERESEMLVEQRNEKEFYLSDGREDEMLVDQENDVDDDNEGMDEYENEDVVDGEGEYGSNDIDEVSEFGVSEAKESVFNDEGLDLLFNQIAELYPQLPPATVRKVAPHFDYPFLAKTIEQLWTKWFTSDPEEGRPSVWSLETHATKFRKSMPGRMRVTFFKEKRLIRNILERVPQGQSQQQSLWNRIMDAQADFKTDLDRVTRTGSFHSYYTYLQNHEPTFKGRGAIRKGTSKGRGTQA
ncbi:hypothetical protein BGX23_007813 [Mortierella sp. AD031]|nr:hypothetical protein BGX23_007813 [Mortierella sp. AD031]KAG0215151.1 hypothetical protein BGX33_001480 [Mortierella sp. NVP41]